MSCDTDDAASELHATLSKYMVRAMGKLTHSVNHIHYSLTHQLFSSWAIQACAFWAPTQNVYYTVDHILLTTTS